MTMVSRFKLRPDVWNRIFNLFSDSLRGIKNKSQFDLFLNDFLSPTEKIMLAKRFAMAVLLAKGNNYDEIKQILRVTSATIAKMNIHIKYGGEGMNKTIDNVLRKQAAQILVEEILSIFDIPTKGLPISEYHKKVAKRKENISRLERSI